ncbi:MAG: thioredoxin domain-containing protein [Gammaproteobacteria bacterium]|nr:thioredoxin domain-containing protein [Gammaproteobacteria bacterium]MYF38808.1 thioredoxin domain-containing protein [Gammaproteobacteria bacterium]
MAKRKHKQDRSVEIVRWSILGSVGLVIAAFLVYAILYTLGVFDGGAKYSTLADREIQSDHIEVIEFFSYECIACQRLEQRLQDFESNLPENVSFSRVHVAFNVQVRRMATMHVALQLSDALDQNHDRIFEEAGKRNNTFASRDRIGDFLDGHGITKTRFENLYQGDRVRRLVDLNNQKVREIGILGTPTLFVANKYVIHPNDPPVMMQTLHQIIDDIRAGRLPVTEEEITSDDELESTEEDGSVDEGEETTSNEDASVSDEPIDEPNSSEDPPVEDESVE